MTQKNNSTSTQPQIARISLESAGRQAAYDYLLPTELLDTLKVGSVVQVPLRTRTTLGIIESISETSSVPLDKLKAIPLPQPPLPLLKDYQRELFQWTCKEFACGLGALLASLFPKQMREEKKQSLTTCVRRAQSKEKTRQYILDIRRSKPAQASVLDFMLKVRSHITLQELLEKTGSSRHPIKSLSDLQWIELFQVPKFSERASHYSYIASPAKKLNDEQKKATKAILEEMDGTNISSTQTSSTHLLFGVTGSGKTEVFLQCMAKALERKEKVLYLVPEIALTPQTTDRVQSRFSKARIELWHSGLNLREKQTIYESILKGEVDIIIGARSAIFIPLDPLALIIIDEEHDSSYKSQSYPYIHTRDIACKRAQLQSCPLILASATPSMEALYQCIKKTNPYKLHQLRERAKGSLPEIEILNRPERALLSPKILDDMRKNFAAGNQSILFLNRRGFFHYGRCKLCKKAIKCPHCDISLTWHQSLRLWRCHVCHFQNPLLPNCPECGQNALVSKCGCGTEQLELVIRKALPEARCLRIDRDSCTNALTLKQKLSEFRTAKADILIGTQMVCKGHHFPLVTRCYIVDADSELAFGDFRAAEHFMQQITQISGRAGRGFTQGKVWIQSDIIDEQMQQLLVRADYGSFAKKELQERKEFFYPPFSHMIHCVFSSKKEEEAKNCAVQFSEKIAGVLCSGTMVSDPAPSVRARLHDRYRWSITIKTPSRKETVRQLTDIAHGFARNTNCAISIDVDALDLS